MDAAARLNAAARALLFAAAALLHPHARADGALPARLSDTGLYAAGSTTQVRPGVLAFAPQYTLWSDGADKQRWIALPPGSFIDASLPDAWQFPPGTKLWKEFSHAGRRVETRTIERLADGSWRYATYLWTDDASEAVLAPARGAAAWPVAQAPGGRYAVPSRTDCVGCHESTATPVLGFSALQLSAARDGHSTALLNALVERGLLRNLPRALVQQPPRIAARSSTERAALGYLHANCGHCHNRSGAGVPLRLTLAQSAADPDASRADTLASLLGIEGRFRTPAWPDAAHLIEPGAPARSTLALRMRSRDARLQMPPLGTDIADDAGLALVERWIRHDLSIEPRSVKP
jgi:mono/diheme cytochrome c family protein